MFNTYNKPKKLPQINAPYSYIFSRLRDEGIEYFKESTNPDDLKPSQSIIYSDKVCDINLDETKPIWISEDGKILDGHHRYGAAVINNKPINCIKISLNADDAIRVLNKIQDIFDYENQAQVQEVVAQDQINMMNEPDSGVSTSEFLRELENAMKDDDLDNDDEGKVVGGKKKKLYGYRKKKINEKSVIGNFFSCQPVDGYKEYEIEFDNLFDTNDIDLYYNKTKNPVFMLANTWFPNIDFEKAAKKFNVRSENLYNRAVAERAISLNYDGIKYGDIMIQAFKK